MEIDVYIRQVQERHEGLVVLDYEDLSGKSVLISKYAEIIHSLLAVRNL